MYCIIVTKFQNWSSMDLGYGKCWSSPKKDSWKATMLLAYQSLGVVYGDLCISPLYVYKSTFVEDIHHSETNEEIFGVLFFVFWTLTLAPLCKWNICSLHPDMQHARVSLLPNRQVADEALSTYKLEPPPASKKSSRVKMVLENHKSFLHTALLLLVLLGTCMVIGDGLLTPAISVFSAVSGLELSMSKDHHLCCTERGRRPELACGGFVRKREDLATAATLGGVRAEGSREMNSRASEFRQTHELSFFLENESGTHKQKAWNFEFRRTHGF
ncbi:hypothetical protein ACS0TY_033630 [Phlomoides rotata]